MWPWRKLPDLLDTHLIELEPGIPVTIKHATEGVFVVAELGWGKTWLVLEKIVRAYLPHMGGVIWGAKAEDRDTIERVFIRAEARDRLTFLGPRDPGRINWFEALLGTAPHGAEVEEISGALSSLCEIGERSASKTGGENGQFFKTQAMMLVSAIITVLRAAGERLTAESIYRFMHSLPLSLAMREDVGWQERSFAHQSWLKACRAEPDDSGKADLRTMTGYLYAELVNLNDRTRSSILSQVSAMLSKLLRGWMRDLWSTTTNIDLREAFNGRWFYFDISPLEYGEAGVSSLVMAKHLFSRIVVRRRIDAQSRPVAMIGDEFQQIFVTADRDLQAVVRSKLGCVVALTQNLTGLLAVMGGGAAAEAMVKSWLALFGCKIAGANSDWMTNSYFSELCGAELQSFYSGNLSHFKQRTPWDMMFGNPELRVCDGSFPGDFSSIRES